MKGKECTGDPGGPDAKSGPYSSGSGLCPSAEKGFLADATTEAEFVAISYGTRHIRWLLKGLADLRLHVLIAMHADNTGAN